MSKLQRPLFTPVVRIPATHDQYHFSGIVGVTGEADHLGRWVTAEGITRQAELAFDVFTRRLGSLGLVLPDVRVVNLSIVDLENNYSPVNEVYGSRFEEALTEEQIMPARVAIGVESLAPMASHPLLVEIGAIASIQSDELRLRQGMLGDGC
jgi:enamine deaminase RidA (YjgF/YER057c/UK114 family)